MINNTDLMTVYKIINEAKKELRSEFYGKLDDMYNQIIALKNNDTTGYESQEANENGGNL